MQVTRSPTTKGRPERKETRDKVLSGQSMKKRAVVVAPNEPPEKIFVRPAFFIYEAGAATQ
jgi:hypothetical protein